MGKNVKKKRDDLDDLIYKSYKTITSQKVYCGLCGKEIIWEPKEDGTNITYRQYQEEMAVGLHKSCFYSNLQKR